MHTEVHDAAGSDDGQSGVQDQLSHQHGSAQVLVVILGGLNKRNADFYQVNEAI